MGDEVVNVIATGTDSIHFDVMDRHYVPHPTIGPTDCDSARCLTVGPVGRIIADIASGRVQIS